MAPPWSTAQSLVSRAGAVWYHSTADLHDLTGAEPGGAPERLPRSDVSRWLPLATEAFLVIGILLRLRMYLFNRSLWFDETLLALNILHRPFRALVPPLEYHQGAPFGFLMLEKAAVLAFGTSEHALRLVPLLASIATLLLLYRLGRRVLPPIATLVAVGLLAVSLQQIGYAAEVKPYSMDTAIALIVSLASIEAAGSVRRRDLVILALTGTVAVWFSYPAVFVLAGAGVCLAAAALRRRHWAGVAHLALVGLAWAISFGLCYVVSLQPVARDSLVRDIWASAFVPWTLSYWTASWILDQNLGIFHDPVGMTMSGLGAFAFVAGLTAGDRHWQFRRWILVSPLAIAFAAAALHRYPYEGRFLNFAVPALVCVMSLGIARVLAATWRTAPVIGLGLVALVFLHPVRDVAFLAARPTGREEIRPVLDYVRQHARDGDALYLYWRTEPGFAYYSERWKNDTLLHSSKVVHTRPDQVFTSAMAGSRAQKEMDALEVMSWADESALFLRDVDALRGYGRVWVVFYHVRVRDGIDEEQWLRGQLQRLGKEEDRVTLPGASAYLFDLGAAPDRQAG